MAVGMAEIRDRHARHQKILQHAILYRDDALRRNPLVVKVIRSSEFRAVEFFQRRIVRDAEKLRQHFLIHFFRERLPLALILLAMAYEPVAQNLMEENG